MFPVGKINRYGTHQVNIEVASHTITSSDLFGESAHPISGILVSVVLDTPDSKKRVLPLEDANVPLNCKLQTSTLGSLYKTPAIKERSHHPGEVIDFDHQEEI